MLPIPDNVIQRVESIAEENKIAAKLVFGDRNQFYFDET